MDPQESKMDTSKGEDTEEGLGNSTNELTWSNCEDDNNNVLLVNLMTKIFKELKDNWNLSWVKEDTGSWITGTTEHHHDYDYLICPTKVECRIEPSSSYPCYCRVFITNKQELPLEFQEILGPDDELTPSKFKEYVFEIFDMMLERNSRLVRKTNKSISPAYTIIHCRNNIEIDLVPCLLVQKPPESYMKWKSRKLTEEEKMSCPVYVIAKRYALGDEEDDDKEELELWRVSFSTFERKILCDKCDKFERIVLIQLKHLFRFGGKGSRNKICSYHLTSNCLHFFEKTPSMSEHQYPGELGEYQLLAINSMICALKSKDIPHFFIPNFNLLQNNDVNECQQLIQKLEQYKEYMEARNQGKRAHLVHSTMKYYQGY